METMTEIRFILEHGEIVSLQRRYVAPVLEGLAADPRGTKVYRVILRPGRMFDTFKEGIGR